MWDAFLNLFGAWPSHALLAISAVGFGAIGEAVRRYFRDRRSIDRQVEVVACAPPRSGDIATIQDMPDPLRDGGFESASPSTSLPDKQVLELQRLERLERMNMEETARRQEEPRRLERKRDGAEHEREARTAFLRARTEGSQIATDSASDAKRGFNLRFEGDGYDGINLIRARTASLVFSDRVLANAYAILEGRKLDRAVEGERAFLTLVLKPPAGIVMQGARAALASFEQGRLVDEARFDFEVAPDCPSEVELLIEFYAANVRLYGVPLKLGVADVAGETTAAPADTGHVPILKLDAAHAIPADMALARMLLTISVDTDRLALNLVQYKANGPLGVSLSASVKFSESRLDTLFKSIRAEIGSNFFAADIWTLPDPGSATWRDDVNLLLCAEKVASAGSMLYQALHEDGKNPDAKALLDMVSSRPVGSRLTITTSGFPFPLELLYSEPFSKNWLPADRPKDKVRPELFWGTRFAIETIRSGAGDYDLLRSTYWNGTAEVAMNLNPTIKVDAEPGPTQIHEQFAESLIQRGVTCKVRRSCETMREALQAGSSTASVIYTYCHGAAAAADAGLQETLVLASGCELRPSDLRGTTRFANAPIVILNACNAGSTSPLLSYGFLEAYRAKEAIGLITTTFFVPIMFGAAFGSKLIEACLQRKVPLSEQLRGLREDAARRGNLAPLFYSVQCQLDSASQE